MLVVHPETTEGKLAAERDEAMKAKNAAEVASKAAAKVYKAVTQAQSKNNSSFKGKSSAMTLAHRNYVVNDFRGSG